MTDSLNADPLARSRGRLDSLLAKIKAWREDDKQGYDTAIELLCDAEDELQALAVERPRPPLLDEKTDIAGMLKGVRASIEFAYTGSAEQGSFIRGTRTEVVPSVFLTLARLEAALADVTRPRP